MLDQQPNPQTENGYTMIANELLEALALLHLPTNEWQVVLVVIRKTYGFKKKVDRIANFQIMNSTGLGKEVVSRALHNLHKKRVITRDGKFIGINKDYSQWKLAKQLTNKLAELLTELAESSTKVSSPHVTQKKKETIQNKDIYIGDGKNGKDRQSAERPRTGGKTNVRRSIGAPLR